MVFAVAGRGDEPQDGGDGLAGGEFFTDDFGLPAHAAKTGEWQQHEAIARGGLAHFFPGGGGAGGEADDATVGIFSDAHQMGERGLALKPESTRGTVVGGDAEPIFSAVGGSGGGGALLSGGHVAMKSAARGVIRQAETPAEARTA